MSRLLVDLCRSATTFFSSEDGETEEVGLKILRENLKLFARSRGLFSWDLWCRLSNEEKTAIAEAADRVATADAEVLVKTFVRAVSEELGKVGEENALDAAASRMLQKFGGPG